MKKCSRCGVEKPRIEFFVDKSKKDNRRYDCKACVKAHKKPLSDKAKARNAELNKKWREDNPEKVKELWTDWSSKNDRTEYMQTYSQANRDKAAAYNLKYRYGISLKEYEEMVTAQNGVCKICKEEGFPSSTGLRGNVQSRNLVVDHCHKTGAIRGLLCNMCNWGLGKFRDNSDNLRMAADYLDMCATSRS